MSTALRRRLEALVQRLWYAPHPGPGLRTLRSLLAPAAALAALVARRRRHHLLRLPAPRVPLVVVGNFVAGGTGKTPLVAAIAGALAARGLRTAIVASGYGARRGDARLVSPRDDPADAGDEALWLAQSTSLPVAAARRRAQAVALLARTHPEVEVIVADDGLQHAGLARSVELAVFDERGTGNGRLLPAGPMRAPLALVASMDALVLNGDAAAPLAHPRTYRFRIEALRFAPVNGHAAPLAPAAFVEQARGRSLAAIAGTAAPQRFFDTLRGFGVAPRCIAIGDHAVLRRTELAALREDLVVMTTKDAVKCARWADDRCWALEVRALPDPDMIDWLTETIRGHTPARDPGMPAVQGPAAAPARRHGA